MANTGHSPQLCEAVQGLPQSQHLSAGHKGLLWAFQHLFQLHLGEHQAARSKRVGQYALHLILLILVEDHQGDSASPKGTSGAHLCNQREKAYPEIGQLLL